jgi:hypothetical protein
VTLCNGIVSATKYHSSKVLLLEVSCGNGQVCWPGIFYNLAPRGFARHHCTDTSKMRNRRKGINILHCQADVYQTCNWIHISFFVSKKADVYPVACLMHEARKGNVVQESRLLIL